MGDRDPSPAEVEAYLRATGWEPADSPPGWWCEPVSGFHAKLPEPGCPYSLRVTLNDIVRGENARAERTADQVRADILGGSGGDRG